MVAASGIKAASDDSEMRMNVFLLEAYLKPVADDCVKATKVGCRCRHDWAAQASCNGVLM